MNNMLYCKISNKNLSYNQCVIYYKYNITYGIYNKQYLNEKGKIRQINYIYYTFLNSSVPLYNKVSFVNIMH